MKEKSNADFEGVFLETEQSETQMKASVISVLTSAIHRPQHISAPHLAGRSDNPAESPAFCTPLNSMQSTLITSETADWACSHQKPTDVNTVLKKDQHYRRSAHGAHLVLVYVCSARRLWSKSPVLFRSYPQANIWLGVRSSDCFMGSYLSLCCTQAEILLDLALVEQTII